MNEQKESINQLSKRIFVSNVPEFYTEKLIKDVFHVFGEIVKIKLIPAVLP